jgi:hypothetical protein
MPAYSFKLQFVGAVEAGDKLHTIRGKRKARPKLSEESFTLPLVSGVRKKAKRKRS